MGNSVRVGVGITVPFDVGKAMGKVTIYAKVNLETEIECLPGNEADSRQQLFDVLETEAIERVNHLMDEIIRQGV